MSKTIYLHQQSKLAPFVKSHKTFTSDEVTQLPKQAIKVVPFDPFLPTEDTDLHIDYLKNTDDQYVYIENVVEGSSTLIRHLDERGLLRKTLAGDIGIIASGEMPEQMNALAINYMLYRTGSVNENHRKISIAKKNKPYTFLFLNNRLRSHRTDLIQQIHATGLLDSALWSNLCMGADGQFVGTTLPKNKLPEKYDPQESKDLIDWTTWTAGPVIKPQYQDTYFSVYAESSAMHRYAFPTEKTWKPIIAGHPFMALANSRHYAYLHELGFKTFTGIIDETWAGMKRWQDAVRWFTKQLVKLSDSDLQDFQTQCKSITTHNKKQFWALYDSYIADTQEKISQLFEQVE